MATQTASMTTDHRSAFADFEGVAYLNTALQGAMPLAAVQRAVEALEWKKHPYRVPDGLYFDLPDRIREKVARLVGGTPEEIAITTGTSSGLAAVAAGIDWNPGDEVLVGRGEFPAHFSAWLRYERAGKLRVRIVEPQSKFICAPDSTAALGPHARVISPSLVRFEDGARRGAAPLARACEKFGTALVLDLAQCAGAMQVDLRALGASMATCSGYKWLLGPYGTGFFWVAREWTERLPLGAVNFMALEGAREFHSMPRRDLRPVPGARRWDSAEPASFTNLAPFDAALDYVLQTGVEAIERHNDALVAQILEALPRTKCSLVSPAQRERRGPYICIAARSPEETASLYEKLRAAQISVSLRENALRISPHIYNTSADISRLLTILSD